MRRLTSGLITFAAVAIGLLINRPFLADVAYQRGQTEINVGRTRQGIPFLWRALAIDPHDAKAAVRIVWAEREVGDDRAALSIADTMMQRFPDDIPLQRERARTLFVMRRYTDAATAFNKILESRHTIVNDALYASLSYSNAGDERQARKMLEIGRMEHPESAIFKKVRAQ